FLDAQPCCSAASESITLGNWPDSMSLRRLRWNFVRVAFAEANAAIRSTIASSPRPGTAYIATSSVSTSRYARAPQHPRLNAERAEFADCGMTAHAGRPIADGSQPYTCQARSGR